MNKEFSQQTAIYGHVSEDTAYVVDDYPYGFTQRTQIRYWVETTKHGDRFVSQTLNPKTGKWNKPKKSTYSEVLVMWISPDDGHVKTAALSMYADGEWLQHFRDVTAGKLHQAQLDKLAELLAIKKVMQHVTFEVKPGHMSDEDKAEQETIKRQIMGAIDRETRKIATDL